MLLEGAIVWPGPAIAPCTSCTGPAIGPCTSTLMTTPGQLLSAAPDRLTHVQVLACVDTQTVEGPLELDCEPSVDALSFEVVHFSDPTS
jgi:hypothetical protein